MSIIGQSSSETYRNSTYVNSFQTNCILYLNMTEYNIGKFLTIFKSVALTTQFLILFLVSAWIYFVHLSYKLPLVMKNMKSGFTVQKKHEEMYNNSEELNWKKYTIGSKKIY